VWEHDPPLAVDIGVGRTGWRPSEPRAGGAARRRAGCFVGMQAPINSRLGRQVGSLQAATFSFLVGTLALLLIASLSAAGSAAIHTVGRARGGRCRGPVGRVLRDGRAAHRAHARPQRPDRDRRHRPARDRGGGRPLRPAGAAKQHIGAPRIVGLVLLVLAGAWCWSCASSEVAVAEHQTRGATRGEAVQGEALGADPALGGARQQRGLAHLPGSSTSS
jgi:hypothetical protein